MKHPRKAMGPLCAVLLFLVPAHALAQGTTGSLQGTVTDATTGDPIPATNVTLKTADGQATRYGAMTNEQGEYRAINIPPGRYQLQASMLGYKPVVIEDLIVTVGVETRTNFHLEKGGPPGGFAGRVTGSDDEPIQGAVVLLLDRQGRVTDYKAATDEEGRFSLGRVASGTYVLQVSLAGYYTLELKEVRVTSQRLGVFELKLVARP